jgi:hypothetical protein
MMSLSPNASFAIWPQKIFGTPNFLIVPSRKQPRNKKSNSPGGTKCGSRAKALEPFWLNPKIVDVPRFLIAL